MAIEDEIDPLRTPLLDPAEDEEQVVVGEEEESSSDSQQQQQQQQEDDESQTPLWYHALHIPLLPDDELVVCGNQVLEGGFSIKLLKFLLLTFGSIFFLHWLVSFRTNHRDVDVKVWQLWVFDGNLIVGDAVVFFVVGRLWQQQRGVDHLAWIGTMILCNLFFESQHYIPFLRHSFTLYEIHCTWPWQLWVFVGLAIPLILTVVVAHGVRAYRDNNILWRKLVELGLCVLFFVAPVVTSPYFHFHHWFAGWLLGMHCNVDVWWSRAAMAWCWGMYINGIAVYGRDPVLTCEYAYFLTVDQKCPYVDDCQVEEDLLYGATALMQLLLVGDLEPADWRNCSASGYHP
jgi:hypothetical protein